MSDEILNFDIINFFLTFFISRSTLKFKTALNRKCSYFRVIGDFVLNEVFLLREMKVGLLYCERYVVETYRT